MPDPYIGQIEVFAFDFAPKGWALCAGQLMSISQNQALFSVIGTTFGGDGITNFALPDLRGRTPIGQGNGLGRTPRDVGDAMGEENHTMTINERALRTRMGSGCCTTRTLPRIPLCPTARWYWQRPPRWTKVATRW